MWVVHSDRTIVIPGGDWLALVVCLMGGAAFWFLPGAFAVPFLIALTHCVARPGPWVSWILSHRSMLFLGKISFSLYLSHFIVMKAMRAIFAPGREWGSFADAAASLAGLPLAIGLAWLLCVWIEEPSRRMGRRVTNDWMSAWARRARTP